MVIITLRTCARAKVIGSVVTPRACAKGKVIGLVVVVVDTKIAKSGDLGT